MKKRPDLRIIILCQACALLFRPLWAETRGNGPYHPPGSEGILAIDLATAVSRAREADQDLSLSRVKLQLLEQRNALAYRSFLPRLRVGYSRNDSVAYFGQDTHTHRLSLGLEQDFHLGKREWENLRIQAKGIAIQRRTLSQREEDRSLRVVLSFLKGLIHQAQGELLEEALFITREQTRIASVERNLGQITELDYLSILLKEKDLELEQGRNRQEWERLHFELQKLLGFPKEKKIHLQGTVDKEYRGFIPLEREGHYQTLATAYSIELDQATSEWEAARETLRAARSSALPHLGLQVNFSVEGAEFPLTQTGVTVALRVSWDAPLIPLSASARAGKDGPYQRTRGWDAEARVGENLEGLLSVPQALLDLRQKEGQLSRLREETRFQISEAFSALKQSGRTLALLRERGGILERKQAIQRLKVALGEVTRLQYLDGEIELFRNRIEVLSAISEVFQREVSILKTCGIAAFGTYPVPLLPALKGNTSPLLGVPETFGEEVSNEEVTHARNHRFPE